MRTELRPWSVSSATPRIDGLRIDDLAATPLFQLHAPSGPTTCEVMTRRKDSRQCEARGLKQDHNYER
jgi:hypothetical protein